VKKKRRKGRRLKTLVPVTILLDKKMKRKRR
jgi:hypothetical protein